MGFRNSRNFTPSITRARYSNPFSHRQLCCVLIPSLNSRLSMLSRLTHALAYSLRRRIVADADSMTMVERMCTQRSAGKP
jgi:hypothetical protein